MTRAWRYLSVLWQPWWISLLEWVVVFVGGRSLVASQAWQVSAAFGAAGFVLVTLSMIWWTDRHGPFTYARQRRR